MEFELLVLFGAVLLAFSVQVAIGFGGQVLALAVAAQVWPIETLVPLVLPLNLLVTSSVLARTWREIDRALLFGRILPLVVPGAAVGVVLFDLLAGPRLQRAYGVLVVLLALLDLWVLLGPRRKVPQPEDEKPSPRGLSTPAMLGWFSAAGVVHGLYATGGPLLVYALNRLELDKGVFRATLLGLWLLINTCLVISYLARGMLGAEQLPTLGLLLPVVGAALLLGSWAHRRLSQRGLRLTVLLILLGTGTSLVF